MRWDGNLGKVARSLRGDEDMETWPAARKHFVLLSCLFLFL